MEQWTYPLLKRDFPSFIEKTLKTVDPGVRYLPNWHIQLIAEYLEAARKKQIQRLIINMPPRSLKSVCVSVAWPCWLMGQDPTSKILTASYAASLSIKHSLDSRLVLHSKWYRDNFPHTVIVRDQNEKHKFMTTERGFRLASSVGGSITGEGGNFLIIDDPLNPTQAMNELKRNAVNRWFDHTFASRLNDKHSGVIVLVMQRLHAQDLTGYLLEKGGWEHLCLPAVMQEKHYSFGRISKLCEPQELLHKARENEALIERAKLELGSTAYAAQYQQEPLAEEEALVRLRWFGRYQQPPVAFMRIVQSWDTAIKSGAKNDASVCLTFGEYAEKSYLLDAKLYRYEYPDLKRALYAMAEQWKPDVILIEDKSSGQQLLQDARRETSLALIATKPKLDKVTRFAAVTALLEAGKMVLPEQAAWLADFENELFSFPAGQFDDQVDALSQYLDWVRQASWNRLRIRSI